MKTIRLVIFISMLALIVVPSRIVRAGGDSAWGEILNPDGSIQWSKLTDLGNTSGPADWMNITLPGGMVIKPECYLPPLPDAQRQYPGAALSGYLILYGASPQ